MAYFQENLTGFFDRMLPAYMTLVFNSVDGDENKLSDRFRRGWSVTTVL